MKLTPELLAKAKETKSAEELLVLAKENDIELTAEEAEKYFSTLHPADGELSDDELDNVSGGGCGGNEEEEYYRKGDRVLFYYDRERNLIFEGTVQWHKVRYGHEEGDFYELEYFKDYTTMWGVHRKQDIIRRL